MAEERLVTRIEVDDADYREAMQRIKRSVEEVKKAETDLLGIQEKSGKAVDKLSAASKRARKAIAGQTEAGGKSAAQFSKLIALMDDFDKKMKAITRQQQAGATVSTEEARALKTLQEAYSATEDALAQLIAREEKRNRAAKQDRTRQIAVKAQAEAVAIEKNMSSVIATEIKAREVAREKEYQDWLVNEAKREQKSLETAQEMRAHEATRVAAVKKLHDAEYANWWANELEKREQAARTTQAMITSARKQAQTAKAGHFGVALPGSSDQFMVRAVETARLYNREMQTLGKVTAQAQTVQAGFFTSMHKNQQGLVSLLNDLSMKMFVITFASKQMFDVFLQRVSSWLRTGWREAPTVRAARTGVDRDDRSGAAAL